MYKQRNCKMKKTDRRKFLSNTSVAAMGLATIAYGCGNNKKGESAAVHTRKKYNWKMVTTWSPNLPILHEGAKELARNIEIMSDGEIKIQVYGGGELIPALETFDAVNQGVAELGHGAAYYWAGKITSAQFFAAVPFGMNAQQTYSWLYENDGLNLWIETYAPFNLVPFPAGNTGGQMGGWFNKKLESVEDLKGLKMRIPGIGGKVITKAGGSAVLSAGGEIYTNLERGVIDATEWIGPYHDYLMGFHKIAKYYYYPGWHEPNGVLELLVNKKIYDGLSDRLKKIIEFASRWANQSMLAQFDSKNVEYLEKLRNEKGMEILRFPDSVLDSFMNHTRESIDEITSSDPQSKKVFESYSKFQRKVGGWTNISESNYGLNITN